MTGREEGFDEEAALWHARLDAPDMEWDRFAAWLEAPAHREAYDRLARFDAELDALAPAIAAQLPANDDPVEPAAPRRTGWWLAGGALAAALAAMVAPSLRAPGDEAVAYATGPAAGRAIALRDGTRITLDRGTRLTVSDGRDARDVKLLAGAAYFDVRHDPARPMTIRAADYEVRDIGTGFGVTLRAASLSVAVASGSVDVGNGDARTPLTAGRAIDIDLGKASASVHPVAANGVASWRTGRLVYQDEPLALVASDVARYTGRAIRVAPDAEALRFSGVLTIGDGSKLVGQLERLLPVRARTLGDGVELVARRVP